MPLLAHENGDYGDYDGDYDGDDYYDDDYDDPDKRTQSKGLGRLGTTPLLARDDDDDDDYDSDYYNDDDYDDYMAMMVIIMMI